MSELGLFTAIVHVFLHVLSVDSFTFSQYLCNQLPRLFTQMWLNMCWMNGKCTLYIWLPGFLMLTEFGTKGIRNTSSKILRYFALFHFVLSSSILLLPESVGNKIMYFV